jgi:putative adenylate-forming enzyme
MQSNFRGTDDPFSASTSYWRWFGKIGETWWTRLGGRTAIDAACSQRLSSLVRHAREHSRFYRETYRNLPSGEPEIWQLPVVTKRALMSRFDEWVTDSGVKRADVEAFLSDRTHIGELFLDHYIIWKSSGTTGEPGIYVQDADALATFDALMAVHLSPHGVAAQFAWEFLARGGRAALVVATGDHFASITSWQRVCRGSPGIRARGFSILDPLPKLVAELNAYQPALLAGYPTMLALLAEEQAAGRLKLRLLNIWSGGECLAPSTRGAIERAFGCGVINEYGASECMSIAFGCEEGWLHLNADWVVLEPVDSAYGPTPLGEPSHTALLTNLANRTQPIIRYDLGDSVLAAPEPCRCGSPLPALRIEGRHNDVLSLVAPNGSAVRLPPLALTTVVEEAVDIHRFQIVQTGRDRLMLRVDRGHARWRALGQIAVNALRDYLAHNDLPNVHVALDSVPPSRDPCSGKLREVVAQADGATAGH